MAQVYFPDFVGRSEKAVVMLLSSLNEKLDSVIQRFHRGEQVAYRFEWYLKKDNNQNDMVVFSLEFDLGERVSIGLAPHHWNCLPYIISLGYLVLMTDPGLLSGGGIAAGEDNEPRALVIHNAFLGLDNLAKQASERVSAGEAGNLDLLLRYLELDPGEKEKRYH